MARPVHSTVSFRESATSAWESPGREARNTSELWGALVVDGLTESGRRFPERVRIGQLYEGGVARIIFEGSYPAALLWVLGVWDKLRVRKRLELEAILKQAFCIGDGECQEEDEDGEEDNLAGTGE